jgi:hypothetical protein
MVEKRVCQAVDARVEFTEHQVPTLENHRSVMGTLPRMAGKQGAEVHRFLPEYKMCLNRYMSHFRYTKVRRPFGKGIFSRLLCGGIGLLLFWYTPEFVDGGGGP